MVWIFCGLAWLAMVLNIAGDYMKSFTTKVEDKDDDDKEKEKAEEAKVCSNFTIICMCKCYSLKPKTGVYRGILCSKT